MLYTSLFLLSAALAHENVVRYRTFFVGVHHGRLCAVRAVRFSPARRPGALLSDYCRFSVVSGWTCSVPNGPSGFGICYAINGVMLTAVIESNDVLQRRFD
ncbi:hypothetical protein B0T13DRAFT_475638 [Neurospora crassa]|nr:hypothetical protein B0T13DRAFT_475638 [Neurospora crassa]